MIQGAGIFLDTVIDVRHDSQTQVTHMDTHLISCVETDPSAVYCPPF